MHRVLLLCPLRELQQPSVVKSVGDPCKRVGKDEPSTPSSALGKRVKQAMLLPQMEVRRIELPGDVHYGITPHRPDMGLNFEERRRETFTWKGSFSASLTTVQA